MTLICAFCHQKNVNSLFLDPASSQEIIFICNSLRPGISAGYDNNPVGIVKETIDSPSEPLCHIINLSITSGVVPDELKIARVIPIFKAGDKRIFSNYIRLPVSVLPIFSKLFERVIYNRLLNFICLIVCARVCVCVRERELFNYTVSV